MSNSLSIARGDIIFIDNVKINVIILKHLDTIHKRNYYLALHGINKVIVGQNSTRTWLTSYQSEEHFDNFLSMFYYLK